MEEDGEVEGKVMRLRLNEEKGKVVREREERTASHRGSKTEWGELTEKGREMEKHKQK